MPFNTLKTQAALLGVMVRSSAVDKKVKNAIKWNLQFDQSWFAFLSPALPLQLAFEQPTLSSTKNIFPRFSSIFSNWWLFALTQWYYYNNYRYYCKQCQKHILCTNSTSNGTTLAIAFAHLKCTVYMNTGVLRVYKFRNRGGKDHTCQW